MSGLNGRTANYLTTHRKQRDTRDASSHREPVGCLEIAGSFSPITGTLCGPGATKLIYFARPWQAARALGRVEGFMSVQDQLFPDPPVAIPSKAVSPTQEDMLGPLQTLLHGVYLLGTRDEAAKATTFGKVPPSVALIESSATALSKAWAAGLGASVLALWAGIGGWWLRQTGNVQVTVLWEAGIASAAAILAIGYILGSDLRGRSAAAVATIGARARVAEAMLRMTEAAASPPTPDCPSAQTPPPAPAAGQPVSIASMVSLSPAMSVTWTGRPATDQSGWMAVAMRSNGLDQSFYVVKGSVQQWVRSEEIQFR
jgi:hypothetical protein